MIKYEFFRIRYRCHPRKKMEVFPFVYITYSGGLPSRNRTKYMNTTFQLSGLILEFFKISSAYVIYNFRLHIHIQHPNCSLTTNFHDLGVSKFNFITITNLKFYKGFDWE